MKKPPRMYTDAELVAASLAIIVAGWLVATLVLVLRYL
jgi:hypothetical protein